MFYSFSDPFANVVSPCDQDAVEVEYFPHPTDNNKFLECQQGKMMILQCPTGELFNQARKSCLPSTVRSTAIL